MVAFTVAHGEVKTYSPEEKVEFETVITNEGGGFLPSQDEFLCPYSGMYLFTQVTVAWDNSRSITEIWMDNTRVATAFATNGITPTAGHAVLVHCTSGSRVYVQCVVTSGHAPHMAQTMAMEILSYFQGILWQKMYKQATLNEFMMWA